jgi:osmotically inducible protein OsmC
MPERRASAVWEGDLKGGKGAVSSGSGALDAIPYSFAMRFEDAPGTNPEELVAAAHAACFSMACANELGKREITGQKVSTTATARFEKTDAGFSVTQMTLNTVIRAKGADRARCEEAAKAAKDGCPISRLLAPGTKIVLDAKYEL